MVLSQKAATAAIAGICVAFVAIRLFHLTDSCLWFDEIFTVHAAEHSWNSILSFVALDLIHPPLFYILLKLWIGVGGDSLFWLRLFPVVFAVIAIHPFLSLCNELKLKFWTRMLALFLFAVNGSLIKYAQEVRMYSLLLCLSLFSIWLFARFLNNGKGFLPLFIINVLLVYTHYFGLLVLGAEVAAVLYLQRARWLRMMTMTGVVLVFFLPWVIAVSRAAGEASALGQNIGWMTRPGLKAVIQFVLNLVEPFYYQASSADPMSIFKVSVPMFLILAAAVVWYFSYWKIHAEEDRAAIKFLSLISILPLSGAFAASWLLPYSVWGSRHLIILFAPVSIFLAIALMKIPKPGVRTAALVFILLFGGYAFVIRSAQDRPQYIWCAWNDVARVLSSDAHGQSAKIYVFEDLIAYHLWFALRDTENAAVFRVMGTRVANDDAYFLPRGFDGVRKIDLSEIDGERITIAFRSDDLEGNQSPISNLVARGYEVVATVPFPVGTSTAYLCELKFRE